MKLINTTSEFATIKIVLANGVKDSINLQPRGRASLPPGSVMDPQFEKQYASYIKTMSDASDAISTSVDSTSVV
jgi:hypothetical protein